MNDPAGTPLLDTALVPDLDAEQELSGDRVEALSDDEISGARVRLLRKTIETIEGGDDVAVALTAEFHPAPATRFTYATVMVRLIDPAGAQVIDVSPVELHSADPVTFKVTSSGKISIEKLVKAELGASRETSYSVYPCLVRGSGAASSFATWSFEEHAEAHSGIGQFQDLILTLSGKGPFQAEVRVAARLLKPGLAGALERVRDMILGPSLAGASHSVTLTVPAAPARSGLFGFFR